MITTEKKNLTESEKRNVERCVNLLSILLGGNALMLVAYAVYFACNFFSDMSALSLWLMMGCSFCTCVFSFLSMIFCFKVIKTTRCFVSF